MDPAKKIDLAAVKKFTISDSKLTSKQKQAAVTKFDSCMAAKYPSPYKLLHYKPNDFPGLYLSFVTSFRAMFQPNFFLLYSCSQRFRTRYAKYVPVR